MLKNIRKRTEGFTIIEVLIVLAIAGLILLIVFLAVPALQRNSRNTQRKNDASAVASTFSNFATNNGGLYPDKLGGDGSNDTNLVVVNSVTSNTSVAKLGFFKGDKSATNAANAGKVYIIGAANPPANPTVALPGTETAAIISTDSVIVMTGSKCNSSNTGVGDANARAIAVLYVVETGSGPGSLQCAETS